MPALTGSNQPVALGAGYSLRAPGIVGSAEVRPAGGVGGRARSAEDGTVALADAMAATGVIEVKQILLQLQPARPGQGPATALRSLSGQDVVEVAVPDLGPDTGQLILACDESGVLTWHLPVDEQQSMQTQAVRGNGGQKRFLIPATPTPAAPAVDAPKRSIVGVLGRKLLKVLIYPVLDPLIGAVSDRFAEAWESRHRPYGFRTFTPESFRTGVSGAWGAGEWQRVSEKRALLFVHGTFSTAQDAFNQLSDSTFAELNRRYEGRLFAFNHFTLSQSPEENVKWFLQTLPADQAINVDIVSHSRGGLVARTLIERPSVFGLNTARVTVGRVVFAGVPNAGTLLAHPDHMVKLLDRITTALNLFPAGIVTEVLESILTAIKVIGHGALKGLKGLACMNPDGDFLKTLNQGSPKGADYYAIAADYVPSDAGIKLLVAGTLADAVVDRVFDHTQNDLVVPEPGVYQDNGCKTFPIADPTRTLLLPASSGILHTTMFGSPVVQSKLLEWLTGG
jgi:hypothetical protein